MTTGELSQHSELALDAIRKMSEIEGELDQAREKRDEAVVRMHMVDGMNPSAIARVTGMSVSNVRVVIRVGKHRS